MECPGLRLTTAPGARSTTFVPDNQPPFDEQAVLHELEQLHHAILTSRREREHAVARFDTFVKGFRASDMQDGSDSPPVADAALIRGPWVSDAAPPKPGLPLVPAPASATVEVIPPEAVELLPEPAPEPDPIASLRRRLQEKDYSAPEEPVVRTWRWTSVLLASAAAGVAVVAALLYVFAGQGPAPASPATDSAVPPRSAVPAAPQPSVPASDSAPASSHAIRVELSTLRPVWMRITVDNNRALERQVPAGQRIPLEGDRTIVVRAGDAGAVRVYIDGRDTGLLGANGEVVTRAFTPSPSATDRVAR